MNPVKTGHDRYQDLESLESDSSGVRRLARDSWVGRKVLVKAMGIAAPHDVAEEHIFRKEAARLAKLEHPAIVPTYDVGRSENGELFLIKRRVRGRNLEDILGSLACPNGQTMAVSSRERLLRVLCIVCQAIDFAHAQGIAHGALTAKAIIVGDAGEVYVDHWDTLREDAPEPIEETNDAGSAFRADVQALGNLLFRITAHTDRDSLSTKLALDREADARKMDDHEDGRENDHHRVAGVPPELEVLWEQARQGSEGMTARALANGIDRFLAGDRDVALRRTLAQRHATGAEALANTSDEPGAEGLEARKAAFREAGYAISLDPACVRAMAVLVKLTTRLPTFIPAEVERKQQARQEALMRAALANGAHLLWACLVFLPVFVFEGVANWRLLGAWALAYLFAGGAHAYAAHRRMHSRWGLVWLNAALQVTTWANMTIGGVLAIFPAIPSLLGALGHSFLAGRDGKKVLAIVATSMLGLLVPMVAELGGWFPAQTVVLDSSTVSIQASLTHFHPVKVRVALVLVYAGFAIVAARTVWNRVTVVSKKRREQLLQSWQFRYLVPSVDLAKADKSRPSS